MRVTLGVPLVLWGVGSAAAGVGTRQVGAAPVERRAVGPATGPATGPASRPAGTVVGRLEVHAIDSAALHGRRAVRVWLPPGYDVARRYGVLYLFDGQNLFDGRTAAVGHRWGVDATMARLVGAGAVEPTIVVGLDHGPDRLGEYTFDADARHGGGGGAATAAFLLDEVVPWVERTYAADPGRRALGGASLGGLLAVDVARRHPGVFGRLMVASPSLWWAGEATLRAVVADASPLAHARVWLDVGTAEEPGLDGLADVERVRRLAAALERGQVEHRLVVEPGAHHDEAAWAGRFPAMVTYLLPGRRRGGGAGEVPVNPERRDRHGV